MELPPDAARIAAVAQYRVVDAAAKQDAAAVVCQLCVAANAAVSHCEECSTFLCEFCSTCHKQMRATAKHVVRALAEAAIAVAAPGSGAAFRRPVYCAEHPRDEVCMYCTACNKAACVRCALLKHKGHDIVETAKAAAGMRERLRAAVAAIGFDAAAEGTFKTALAAKLAHVTGVHDATTKEVNAAADVYVRAVYERRDALNKVADELLAAQTAALRAQAKCIELHVDGVAHAIKFALDVAEHGTDSEAGVTHVSTLARLAGAKAEHAAVPWTPACEGPSTLRLATREAMWAWLNETCTLIAVREAVARPAAAAGVTAIDDAARWRRLQGVLRLAGAARTLCVL